MVVFFKYYERSFCFAIVLGCVFLAPCDCIGYVSMVVLSVNRSLDVDVLCSCVQSVNNGKR